MHFYLHYAYILQQLHADWLELFFLSLYFKIKFNCSFRIWWWEMKPASCDQCWSLTIQWKMELSGKLLVTLILKCLWSKMIMFIMLLTLTVRVYLWAWVFRNWKDMCHVWDYTFGPEKMNIDPKECKILLTEPPMNPIKNREKMIEVSVLLLCYQFNYRTYPYLGIRASGHNRILI